MNEYMNEEPIVTNDKNIYNPLMNMKYEELLLNLNFRTHNHKMPLLVHLDYGLVQVSFAHAGIWFVLLVGQIITSGLYGVRLVQLDIGLDRLVFLMKSQLMLDQVLKVLVIFVQMKRVLFLFRQVQLMQYQVQGLNMLV